ncbi:MAG: transposase [Xanthobacteraceae bacterium]
MEVLSGPERRRRWSAEQKRSIVAEAFAAGASVCEVARRFDVVPGQIYRWRHDLRGAAAGFAEVVVASMNCPERSPEPSTPCGNAGTVRNDRVGPGCNRHENETSADRGDKRRTERCECERSRLLRLLCACAFTASAAGRERTTYAFL